MPRTLFTTTAFVLLAGLPSAAPANDIIDFLRAINGAPEHHHHHYGRDRVAARHVHRVGHRRDRDFHRYDRFLRRRPVRPLALSNRGLSFSVNVGDSPYTYAPPPPAVVSAPVYAPALPHAYGEIVTCPVALEPHVRVRGLHRIAPNAIPVVVAVRDPHLGRFGHAGCVEQLVYVQVMVPTCPLQCLRVSPCKTKIVMDYGHHSVTIISRNDCVDVIYRR